MPTKKYVLGSFRDENQTVSAIEAFEKSPWELDRVHSPFLKRSRVGYFTLAGGLLGFFTGFALAIYTAVQWNIIVSGKPVVAWISFLIVGFEFTILFAVFGNILGFLTQARLPEFESLKIYDPRSSGEYFGVMASCVESEQEKLMEFLKSRGGEVKVFEREL
jgi:molybdopterin-containing oxidoreductase family membrane subunit